MKILLRLTVILLVAALSLPKRKKAPYLWLLHYLIGSGKTKYLKAKVTDAVLPPREDEAWGMGTEIYVDRNGGDYPLDDYGVPEKIRYLQNIPIGTHVRLLVQNASWLFYTVGGFTAVKISDKELVALDHYDWHVGQAVSFRLPPLLGKKIYHLIESNRFRKLKWALSRNGLHFWIDVLSVEDEFWASVGGKKFDTRLTILL